MAFNRAAFDKISIKVAGGVRNVSKPENRNKRGNNGNRKCSFELLDFGLMDFVRQRSSVGGVVAPFVPFKLY